MLAHLDGLSRELSAERPAARAEPATDFKRLAAELVEARTNAVRLVVKGIISEQDAAKQLTELKRDEEALEARRVEHERRQTHDTEEARRAAFAKLTEYRGVWARLSATLRSPVPGLFTSGTAPAQTTSHVGQFSGMYLVRTREPR